MADDQDGVSRPLDRFLRAYRYLTYALLVVGAATAIFFFATGDAVVGSILAVLTAMLWPSFRLGSIGARRGFDRRG